MLQKDNIKKSDIKHKNDNKRLKAHRDGITIGCSTSHKRYLNIMNETSQSRFSQDFLCNPVRSGFLLSIYEYQTLLE